VSEYNFTQDWFHWAPEVWEQLVPMLPSRKAFLEIGSFEGRSTVWTIENMMEDGGFIDCLDTWEGGAEHVNDEMSGAETRFDQNTKLLVEKYHGGGSHAKNRRVYKYKDLSSKSLARIYGQLSPPSYDFIYIDGSHRAKDVMTDACLAWPLLKVGGFMVFDDYSWAPEPRDILYRPKIAVDAFTTMFAEEAQVVFSKYQLIVKKEK